MSYDPVFATPCVMWRRPIGSARSKSGHLVDGAHCQTAIILPGGRARVWLVVIQANGVRVVSSKDRTNMVQLRFCGEPYPLRQAVERMRHAGKTLGITARAAAGLDLALLTDTVEVDRRDRR